MAKTRTPRTVKQAPSSAPPADPDHEGEGAAGAAADEPLPLRDWVAQARELGLPAEQQVWQVHVVRGRDLVETARLLELPLAEVERHFAQACQARAERAPKTARERSILREMLWDMMLDTYAMACGSRDPRVLGLRLKTVDEMSDLHGLKKDPGPEADVEKPAHQPCLPTLQESEELQMEVIKEIWHRDEEVRAIKKVMAEAKQALANGGMAGSCRRDV